MYEKIVWQINNILRSSVGSDEFIPLILQLMAWIRLSRLRRITGTFAFNADDISGEAKQLGSIFQGIAESGELGQEAAAFAYASPALQHISAGQLIQILELLATCNLDAPWPIDELLNIINDRHPREQLSLPNEVIKLMVELAKLSPKQQVYIPFEHSFQLTAAAQTADTVTHTETAATSALPWLIKLLAELNTNIHIGDSIEKPGFLDDGHLTKFKTSIAFPPMGVRYEPSLSTHDTFNRFPEKTSAIGVLSVRHLLSRTNGRIVVAVPNGLLFSPGAERALREDLLEHQRIETVITLPPALLAGSALQFSLLVIRTDIQCEDIVFIDGYRESFYVKDGKGRATLSGWPQLAQLALTPNNGPNSSIVPTKEVLANDAQLQASRYCKSPDSIALEKLLNNYQTRELHKLVNFVRPFPPASQDGIVTVSELGPADFPEFGYALTPGREIRLSEQILAKGNKQFLRPLDIVLAIKGSVGKIAILPPELPYCNTEEWVPGQSCLVLRVKDKSMIDPRVIFSFLKSDAGQMQLKQLISGASVPLIQLRELEKMKIPVPDKELQNEAISDFERIVEIEQKVTHARNEQRNLNNSVWKL